MNAKNKTKDSISKLKAFELTYARIICTAGVALYPFVGAYLFLIDSEAIDFIGHRIAISILFGTVFIASFKYSYIRNNALLFSYIGLFLGIFWSIWISSINQFSSNYSIILLTGIAATASIILNRNLIVLFLISTTLALYISVLYTPDSLLNPTALPLCTTMLLIIFIVRENYRKKIVDEVKSLNGQLLKLNENLEEKVVQRTCMLEQKNSELEKLTYIVSHDLKTPLRNIGSFSSLIKRKIDGDDKESIKAYSEIISKSVTRMSNIISDLLSYGKIDQDRKDLEFVNIQDILNEIIELDFSSNLYNNVKFNFHSNFPEEIYCDKKQISLLLENLISNAIKYNDSAIKFVTVYYEDSEEFHKICVKDNGIGISEKYKEKIFEMFSRLHTQSQYDGTGVGLSICKKIVFKHGGEISFCSKHGEGTTFYFTISKKLNSVETEILEQVS